MASKSDIARVTLSLVYNTLNIFNIPYYQVKVYKDEKVIDITEQIKLNSIIPKGLIKSPFLNEILTYQFYNKNTNKYYIIETTLYNIRSNNVIFGKEYIQVPRKLIAPVYDIYINGRMLTYDEKLVYKNHYKSNILYLVFLFNDIILDSIIIIHNDIIIHKYYDNFNIMKIGDIWKYM